MPGAFAARSAFLPAVRRQRLGFPPFRPALRRGDPGAKRLVCRGRRLLTPRGLAFGLFTRRTAGFELRHRVGAPLFLRSGEIFLGICAVEPGVFRQFFRARELLGRFIDSGKLFPHRRHFRFQLRQAAAGTVTALSLQGAQPRLRLRKRAALLPAVTREAIFFSSSAPCCTLSPAGPMNAVRSNTGSDAPVSVSPAFSPVRSRTG
ncbi:MAG: hypothetical protein ACLUN6_04040 [Holdemanella sp.]|uniref:hypothetical protein n=1 Tax=Holdemanella sp. TaxID=1971762 RepID=UPI0039936050